MINEIEHNELNEFQTLEITEVEDEDKNNYLNDLEIGTSALVKENLRLKTLIDKIFILVELYDETTNQIILNSITKLREKSK